MLLKFSALVSGLLFGMGMAISGMVDPVNVIGFLDVAGNWDPSLAFVMGGALLVFTPAYHFLIKPKHVPVVANEFCVSSVRKIDNKLLAGAATFGVGWGLAGVCPGPVVSSLSTGNPDTLIFFVSMMLGFSVVNVWQQKQAPRAATQTL
ncbi:transporter (plasmid) [Vibrio sp. qd031]|uniref:YeeE/YedE family protein n=1 Tax=Vibrio sp. qd031 TaxID=1603038 RepID=UPI000A109633|nr:YeeE/YedE family protein [Vibrio sp. qd031]ORT52548.1 transporter [Vibrio sp. qd031]